MSAIVRKNEKHASLGSYIKDRLTQNESGKIKAKAKGSCKIYIFAADGVRKTVKVTVK